MNTYTATVKFAPLATAERAGDPAWEAPDRVLLWRNALRFLPGRVDAPLLVDHDIEIGRT